MNVRLWVGNILFVHFLNSEFLNHPKPHNWIKDLKQRLRKGIGQHDSMNVYEKLLIRPLDGTAINDVYCKTGVNDEYH